MGTLNAYDVSGSRRLRKPDTMPETVPHPFRTKGWGTDDRRPASGATVKRSLAVVQAVAHSLTADGGRVACSHNAKRCVSMGPLDMSAPASPLNACRLPARQASVAAILQRIENSPTF